MTQPPGSHLDLDTVADLDADLLPADAAASARAHLDGCAGCREELARLRSTRVLLSTLPPAPIPPAVADRIDAALAHEREAPQPRGTVVPLRTRRLWNNPAIAGAAAGVAVLLLVGAIVIGSVRGSGNDSKESAGSSTAGVSGPAARQPVRSVKVWNTGRTYTAASLATLVPPLVTGAPPASATSGSGGTANSVPATPSPATSSGGFTIEQLRGSPDAILDCGRILSGGAATTPLAVDFGTYAGKPAAIFALPSAGHPEALDVWVVRSTCSASSLDYYFRRIPRG